MTSFIDDSGNELDYDGNDFIMSKQAVAFHVFKFKGNVSVNIKIKATAKNRKTLNYYGVNQIDGSIKKLVNVYKNGNKIDRGYLVLISDDDEEFEAFFLSGNATWFDLWDFFCNEIVTSKYDMRYYYTNSLYPNAINNSWANTDGIIFPVIDWAFNGQKWSGTSMGTLNCYVGTEQQTPAIGSVNNFVHEIMPCLYIHTLLKLLANHAGTNIGGNIFDYKFFKTIVITPDGPEIYRNIGTSTEAKVVKPEQIAPKIKAFEMLKWVAVSFGCVVTFDSESNSISIDRADQQSEIASDWSEYYISHELMLNGYFQNNEIKYKQQTNGSVVDYNILNDVLYGDANINSDKGDGSRSTVYTAPFYSSYDVLGSTKLKFATPEIGFYKFTDTGDVYDFDSVVDGNPGSPNNECDFTSSTSSFPWNASVTSGNKLIVRIECDNGIYTGFHVCESGSTTRLRSRLDNPAAGATNFYGTSTGKIYIQSVEYVSGHKVLSVIPSVSPSAFCQYPGIGFDIIGGGNIEITSTATAYFHKKLTPYSILNGYTEGLAYGDINEATRLDVPLLETNLKSFNNILKNPPIRMRMLIPEQIYAAYQFEPVYIKTRTLSGKFIVQNIETYVDSSTPCYATLVKID